MKNFLRPEERASLKGQHRRERDKRICDRIKADLLSDDGWTQPMIAKALLLDDQTVGNYIKDYRESGKLKHENGGSQGKLTVHETKDLISHLEATLYLHIHEICTYVEETYGKSYTIPGMQSCEGFDDSRLDTLFLTMSFSWHGTLAQYAGRLHRLHHSKKEVIIYDYVDSSQPMLSKMADKRMKGYGKLGYSLR